MKKLLLVCCLLGATIASSAEDLKLTVPELEPKLTYDETMTYHPGLSLNVAKTDAIATSNGMKADFDFFKSKTNPGVKPYKFMDDITFVGVPLFVAGIAIKGDKAMFAQNNKNGKKNTQLLTDFKTGIDDYSQYFGPVMTVGLKLGGYEGRSDWPRLLASAGMSYGIMAAIVNGIKYTAKEMRPDGSQANSWPSGHTATAFVGASLLHKEYGLTRSPWWSVAGYGVATATGVMRIMNNRHWISDVMSGAGIGIMSTELGYALCDLMFKGKGLLRNDLQLDFENPSFFSISMGLGLGSKDLGFTYDDLQNKEDYDPDLYSLSDDERVKFRAATVVDAEGAYFFNKYVGVGGRLRVRAMSAKSFGQYANISAEDGSQAWEAIVGAPYIVARSLDSEHMGLDMRSVNLNGPAVTEVGGIVQSDHLTEFTASAGLYLNLPLSNSFALGAKFLVGRSINQDLDIDGYAKGNVKDINYGMVVVNNELVGLALDQPVQVTNAAGENETYDVTWDYLNIGAKNSTSLGTGISLTYRYKSNFSWRVFCDYDYTKKDFTLKADPYNYMRSALADAAYGLVSIPLATPFYNVLDPVEYKRTKKMNYFTLGMSFLVNL